METYRAIIISLSSLLTLAAIYPYLTAIIKGATKPRLASWGVWVIVLAIGGIAALLDHQLPAAILMLSQCIECGLVVLLGWRHGNREIGRFDAVCLAVAGVGLVLWLTAGSPAYAVTMAIIVDLSGTLPTLRHSWQRPYEETFSTFFLFTMANILTLLVVNYQSFTAVAYPLYDFLWDVLAVSILLFSPNRKSTPKPAAPEPLMAATDTRQPIFSRSATIAEGKTAVRFAALAIPMLGTPAWKRQTVPLGQPAELTVPVTIADPARNTGLVFGEYSVGPINAAVSSWSDDMAWDGKTLTATLGPFLGPGTFQVNVRAKYELGQWSKTSSALLTITPLQKAPTVHKIPSST